MCTCPVLEATGQELSPGSRGEQDAGGWQEAGEAPGAALLSGSSPD